jgi:microcystin-dependent protein
MSNVFIGQITMFGGNFAPRGFAFCNGQLLPIAQNQALFSLLGTVYGGNGIQTFALPNLQCNLPIGAGHGRGLSNYAMGQVGGVSSVNLNSTMMPNHTHVLNATQTPGSTLTIGGTSVPGQPTGTTSPEFYASPVSGEPALIQHPMAAGACGPAGGGQPHTNLMPSLCITFVIALQGLFPSRN